MSDAQRAEKIALAKRKLKEFESRRRGAASPISVGNHSAVDGRCSSLSNGSVHSIERLDGGCLDKEPFMVVNSTGADSLQIERQTNGSSVSSMNSSVVISNGTQDDQACPSSISNTFSSAIEARLQQERDNAISSYMLVKDQLAQLHDHYSQLHTAYSQLSGGGIHSDMENQILQLQSAISVLVEEKTALQSQLRVAKESGEQLGAEVAQLRQAPPVAGDSREVQKLRQQLEQMNSLTGAQTAELETQRRQAAETQAHLLSVQNDKSEAQLRVKVLYKERDSLQEELSSVKKELQMKLLHLKQLSNHQGAHDSVNHEQQIQALTAKLEELSAEAVTLKAERDAVLREASTTRRQFEEYSTELAAKNNELRASLEESEAQRVFAENKFQELEMQISYLQKASETPSGGEKMGISTQKSPAEADLERKLAELEASAAEREAALHERLTRTEKLSEEKEAEFASLREEFASQAFRLRQMDERMKAGSANETELLSLSEQLQNEKATVSRAVAQNKELKEQLFELEDRLVSLTNSQMQCELEKQTAEHQVKMLTEQLAQQHPEAIQASTEEAAAEEESMDSVADAGAVEALAMHGEREQELQQKLEQTLQELNDVRQELRRSHSRNEQMNQIMMNNAEDENQNSIHVELGQALERINILAAETDQLREQLRAAHDRETELHASLTAALAPKETPVEAVEQVSSEAALAIAPVEEGKSEEVPKEEVEEAKEAVKELETYDVESWARTELEKKFTEAMKLLADQKDALERLEHLNIELQAENETIGDHVILYHQQRKLIQSKLRAKEEQMAAVEADRRRVLDRCQELQQALKEVMANREMAATTASVARKVYRSYSHSTVDEMSGDEDVLVSPDEANEADSPFNGNVRESEEGRTSPTTVGTPPPLQESEGAAMQRIMNLLDEINTPITPAFDQLHCGQCIGELKSM